MSDVISSETPMTAEELFEVVVLLDRETTRAYASKDETRGEQLSILKSKVFFLMDKAEKQEGR